MAATSHPSGASNAITKSSFLSLPTEMRLEIYSYLLIARSKKYYWDGCNGKQQVVLIGKIGYAQELMGTALCDCWGLEMRKLCQHPLELFPKLLRTCRQIQREATPILYSENIFHFELDDCVLSHVNCDSLTPFKTSIGSRSATRLRSIEFEAECFWWNYDIVWIENRIKLATEWLLKIRGLNVRNVTIYFKIPRTVFPSYVSRIHRKVTHDQHIRETLEGLLSEAPWLERLDFEEYGMECAVRLEYEKGKYGLRRKGPIV